MGFIKDLIPVFKKSKLTFLNRRQEVGNISSFLFQYDPVIHWKAGQHGILSFPRKLEGGSWRGFSIASHPNEGIVLISTRITDQPSAYKKALMELKPGDELSMRGPFGPFYLDGSKKPVVFIAGGIGITPYRSLILHSALNTSQAPSSVRLLYIDNTGNYAYRQELDDIAIKNDFIKVEYGTSEDLYGKIADQIRELGNSACYYISGPGKMVTSIKKSLTAQGIAKNNIKHEHFIGL